ncbi:4-azaleucine resistance probable transporter AzlC [Pelagirhabdus alkalitolerans]|uniref:4-azaleucine resistance probable transporter AzlC n=1 Tax=Pelagirhabdus alkalitolerans TaxID=1612202 RepID=A0A1G6N4P4_9BACI|nr:AzlC family ABC transporter permease [Pelagirhabdus alkalitolerans]SDC62790.1 4-azaleucine resistance probable transporter AzlC [Pelagirhabdus alkalitolerans]
MIKEDIQKGMKQGMPIMLGYFPIALTFGVVSQQAGLSLVELTSMSILVYAGAAQFMAVNLLMVSAGLLEITIATFVLNFRHFVMSLSFVHKLEHINVRWKTALTSLLTDESFALASMDSKKEKKSHYYYLGLFSVAYLSWIMGSFLGGVMGDIFPERLSVSLGIALYAMFIALLIPSIQKNRRHGWIALIAMAINYTLSFYVDSGWSIVLSTIFASGIGTMFIRREA